MSCHCKPASPAAGSTSPRLTSFSRRFETYYIQSGRAFLGDTLDNRRYPDVLSYPVRYFVLQNDLGLEQQIAR